MRQGREQFGDEHEKKLRQLVSSWETNLTITFGFSLTILSVDWIWSAIPQSVLYFFA